MLKPRWRKVIRDLWLNKIRTLLVMLSIAVGVFAIGTVSSSYIILTQDLAKSYQATNPAHAWIMAFQPFNEKVVEAIEKMPEVKEAEGRRQVMVRAKTGPDEWRVVVLGAIADFDDIQIDKISPDRGAWPPPDNELLIERSALPMLKAKLGDVLIIKTPDGKERAMPIAGIAHDLNAQMYTFDGVATGYITTNTLDWLGQDRDFNELRILVADQADNKAHIQVVANRVRDKIEAAGSTVGYTFVPQPGKHLFLDPMIRAISFSMGAMGIMSLLLSGFLVINTISALLAQQTRQIGMMKAVGAKNRQVISMYLVTVVIFGVLALLIAIPLGVVGAHLFSKFIASYLNFDVTNLELPTGVLITEIAVGLLLPLIAAFFPIISGTRITVREAVGSYGLGKGQFGTSLIDRLLLLIQRSASLRQRISRPLLLSVRNTFRRKTRLMFTLMTLILGGAIFITVFSVRDSMIGTLWSWMDYYNYDVAVQFERDYRIERIVREALQIPGVVEAETWGFYNTRRERPDGSNSDNIILFAPPANTKLVKPTVVEGRWLLPDDQNAIVVNTIVLRDEPDLQLGSKMILKIEGREQPFEIVGIATGGMPMAQLFTNYPYFAEVSHSVGRSQWLFATTTEHNLDSQSQVARALEERFEYIGFNVGATAKVEEEMGEVEAMFEVIVVLLLLMAFLLAVIGGLGLMGTMSINVLERTREIGVIRAIGASNRSVRRIFIVEGIIIGVLSWLVGAVLAIPLSKTISDVIGGQFLNTPLNYTFSVRGAIIWLVAVITLSAFASFLPAWNASRLTVREILAYE